MSFNHGKTLKNGVALCVLAGLISGCTNTGDLMNSLNSLNSLSALNSGAKKFDVTYLKQTIYPGKTTKTQITQMFGAPSTQELNSTSTSNESNWTYAKQEEGLDRYMKLANKYVSDETRMKMYDASAQIAKVQKVASDVSSATGTNTSQGQAQGTVLTIYFVDDVVKYYRVY